MANKAPVNMWKKGCPPPNPKGAPIKDESLTFLMKKFLEKTNNGETDKTNKQVFIEKVYNKAVKEGDTGSIKLIWNYIDGAPKQKMDIQATINSPLTTEEAMNILKSVSND